MKNLRSAWILFAAIVLVAFAVPSSAGTKVFELRHRQGAALAESVRQIVGADGSVTAFGNHLVVTGDTERLADVDALLEALDRPPRTYRVTVAADRSEFSNRNEIGGAGRLRSGNVLITGDPPARPHDDLHAVARSGRGRLDLTIGEEERQLSRRVESYLVVSEGEPARIAVGREVPYSRYYADLCRRHAGILIETAWQTIISGFEVRPEAAGDAVILDIRPFLSFVANAERREVVFQDLSSRVHLPLGIWYDLGGQLREHDEVSRSILGRNASAGQAAANFRVRIDLQP